MNTIHDMRNLLLNLYFEGLEKYPDDTINRDNEESFYNRINYILEIIDDYDSNFKEDFMMLATTYYYLLEIPLKNVTFENEEENCFSDLINLIENEDYNIIYEGLEAEQYRFLGEVLSYIIDNDLSYYVDKDYYMVNDIEDYNEYLSFKNIKTRNIMDVVLKLHPNMEVEEQRYKKYIKDNEILTKISNIKIKSLSTFIQVFMMLKSQFTYKCYLGDFIKNVLDELILSNEELYKDIVVYIIKYTYIEEYLHNKDFIDIEEYILESIKELDYLDNCFIEEFTNYDLTSFYIDYSKIPEDVKKHINTNITLNKLENFGIFGIWSSYEKEIKKINSYFHKSILEDDTKKIIYYSIDKDGNYTIPRICLEIIDNKIVNIIGRESYGNIEFELLDILREKMNDFDNADYLQSELLLLDKLYEIEQKLKIKKELSIDDIDLLYEINYNLDEVLFSNYQYKLNILREKTDIKKDLSKYYNCPIDLIALEQGEINDKTVITTFFFPNESKCNYPNLKIIFSDAWGDFLESAEGLPSLEYIKGDAMFANLKSSYGLSKLVRIDGNAIFNSLEDDSYFNPNLIIKGNPGEYDNGFVLKK